jgi:hypothetical protein
LLLLLLQAWSQQGKRGIWLKVPIGLSQLIPVAVEPGFIFHHAEKVRHKDCTTSIRFPRYWKGKGVHYAEKVSGAQQGRQHSCWCVLAAWQQEGHAGSAPAAAALTQAVTFVMRRSVT